MRGAAQGWEGEFTDKMESVGFTRGRSTPVIFRNDETETTLVVHGDDFTFLGYPEELDSIRAHMETWWDIKLRGIIGNDPGDDKTITILNRVLHWDGEAITLKADSKHRSSILEAFDLTEESKGITVPAEPEAISKEDEEEELDAEETRTFRSLAARANYLGQDRPDIQYSTKEVCRGMARPNRAAMKKMKRLARYLLEVPEGVIRYDGWVEKLDKIQTYVDSDWVGC